MTAFQVFFFARFAFAAALAFGIVARNYPSSIITVDDGLIHLTTDGGKKWSDVTPPPISAWQKISLIDAGQKCQRE